MVRGRPGYEQRRHRSVWQTIAPDRHPASIVTVTDTNDAAAAVLAGRSTGHRVSLMSSGHSYLGNGLQDGTLLLDLTALDAIEVDLLSGTARVGPAVTNEALDAALEPADRAFPLGHSPGVAVGGYLLGGGLGWNPDGWGLAACAHVVGATVLLASGQIVRASAEEHPDLFWALRGAGPCFPGVVLAYEVSLLPRPRAVVELGAGFSLSALDPVARWACSAMTSKAPDVELAVMLLSTAREGGPTVRISATAFADDEAGAHRLLEPLLRTLPPGAEREPVALRPRTFAAMLAENDAPPQRYAVDGAWSDRPLEVIRRCAERFRSCPSPDSLVHISLRSHPALPVGTAFSIGGSTFAFCSSVWDDPDHDLANHAWQDALMDDLLPLASGCYVNEIDYVRHPDRLQRCFSADAWARLEQVQHAYDPEQLFFAPNRPHRPTPR